MRNVTVSFINRVRFMSIFMGDIEIINGMVVFTEGGCVYRVPLSNVSYIEDAI